MNIYDIITKKKNGDALTRNEVSCWIDGCVNGYADAEGWHDR